jgi:ketosteroid isomerase-like protein
MASPRELFATPREVLRRFHAAMQARSADALADLYTADAIVHCHDFMDAFGIARALGRPPFAAPAT